MRLMVIDTSNILFRIAAVNATKNIDVNQQVGLSMHTALITFSKYYNKYKPDKMALTFEGSKNWRKAWTADSNKNSSGKLYKANRIKDDRNMEAFFLLISSFKELVKNHSSMICLHNDILEGDDLFAGFVQKHCEAGDEVIGVSGDGDFCQLLKYKNFTLINPANGNKRTLIEACGENDAKYFLFEKCIRGDKGDNVFPAYPNVRSTRIKKAYNNDLELVNFMNEKWSIKNKDNLEDFEEKEFRVGDLYEQNRILIDLSAQPPEIRQEIEDTVEKCEKNHGHFSIFHFIKFCNQYNLKEVISNMPKYIDCFTL